uniref:Glutaredoxin 5 n=1 Tax=Felis catus TaxID=9685 RepID=A0ABI7XGU3_FELCA
MSGSLGRVAVALLRWGRGAGGGGLWGPGVRAAGSGGGGGGSAEQLDALVKKDKVVVFLKGTPEQPQCGFSNAVVQILRLHGVRDYAAYNVLDDPQLRQEPTHVLPEGRVFGSVLSSQLTSRKEVEWLEECEERAAFCLEIRTTLFPYLVVETIGLMARS